MIYNIHNKSFTTKANITKHVKSILGFYDIETYIHDEDYYFLIDLMQYHPNHKKFDRVVEAIYVDRDPYQVKETDKCFWVRFENGDFEDFSAKKCIENIDPKTGRIKEQKKQYESTSPYDGYDPVFLAFYDPSTPESLNEMGGVYMGDGMWVYPDGTMGEW